MTMINNGNERQW